MKPIFILGCPRSGTTLLGALLGTHPDYLAVPEFPFKFELIRQAKLGGGNDAGGGALAFLENDLHFRNWEVSLNALKSHMMSHGESAAGLISALIESYGEQRGNACPSAWIDHTPMNSYYAATLFDLYPDAGMIHIVRDGRAVAASVKALDWGPNTVYPAADWWVKQTAYGVAAETRFPGRVLRVKYEELILDTETNLQGICDFAGLEFHPDMLAPTGFKLPQYTKAQHTLIGKPIQKSRIDDWKISLTEREVEIFEWASQDFLAYLGYERLYGIRAKGMTLQEMQEMQKQEQHLQMLNQQRHEQRQRSATPD